MLMRCSCDSTRAKWIKRLLRHCRTAEDQEKMLATLAECLWTECGLEGTDLVVSCAENKFKDWSFGLGEAQYLNKKL